MKVKITLNESFINILHCTRYSVSLQCVSPEIIGLLKLLTAFESKHICTASFISIDLYTYPGLFSKCVLEDTITQKDFESHLTKC